jgi:hypothetical protein
MQDISLHLLDVAENSIAAGATVVKIRITEDIQNDILSVVIEDNGKGIPKELVEKVLDPFHTSRTTRNVGLGLPLLAQSAREADGYMTINSVEKSGTVISAHFRYSHIDRKPIGNIVDTLVVLIAGNPGIDFIFDYIKGDKSYSLDTSIINAELDGIPINDPSVISAIKSDLEESLKDLKQGN